MADVREGDICKVLAVFGVFLVLALVHGDDHLEAVTGLLGFQGEDSGELVPRLHLEGGGNADRMIAGVGNGAGLGGHQGAGGGVGAGAGQIGRILVDLQLVAHVFFQGTDGEGLHRFVTGGGKHVGNQGAVLCQGDPALGAVAGKAGAVVLVKVVVCVQGVHGEEHDGVAQIGGVFIGDVGVAVVGGGAVAPGVLDDPGAVARRLGQTGEIGLAVVVVPAHQGDSMVGAVVVAGRGADVAVGAADALIGRVVVIADECGAELLKILLDRAYVGGLDPVHAGDVADIVGVGVLGVDGAAGRGFGVGKVCLLLAGCADPAHQRQRRFVAVAAHIQVRGIQDRAVTVGEAVLIVGVGIGEIRQVILRKIHVCGGGNAAFTDGHLVFDHIRFNG